MTSPAAPTQPVLVVPCSGFAARPLPSGTHAELIVQNPLVHASLVVDAEQLGTLIDALAALRDSLDPEAAAGLSLVTPASAGKLVGPNGVTL